MADVTLKNVSKVYGEDVVAVKDFNLDIRNEEFIVFVGPSGCGKSTTLRMIAGLEEITEGEIYIGDRKVNDVSAKDRDIAMVFQSYALYPHMTIYDNMAFSLKLSKVPKKEIEEKIKNASEILGLNEYLNRKPKNLSGGQRQRVALGRAIVRNPKVFLMDEPLSNLDAKLRVQTRTEITKLHQQLNTTFIYVTHDQTEAMTMGQRVVVMNKGIIQQVDTPQNIYHNPINQFVAGFIGSPRMNMLKGTVSREGGQYKLAYGQKSMILASSVGDKLKKKGIESQEVIFGFRPENCRLSKTDSGFFDVAVDQVEMLGSDNFNYVVTESGENIINRSASNEIYQPGDALSLLPDPESIHIFDVESGAALSFSE
ncbi:ABC transporter ATP-binding protein [Kallipyga gabonensis]|uniref:ABC transporter ATP-binding protein n=1 Tax=Kallipyga gabonensis TaxID=1686287 RepID=UPI0006B51178|nr:sn-glycerol-3-phosphate ABC transporter ATP-binding protein UgpC [Kallipyga gabonensis]